MKKNLDKFWKDYKPTNVGTVHIKGSYDPIKLEDGGISKHPTGLFRTTRTTEEGGEEFWVVWYQPLDDDRSNGWRRKYGFRRGGKSFDLEDFGSREFYDPERYAESEDFMLHNPIVMLRVSVALPL